MKLENTDLDHPAAALSAQLDTTSRQVWEDSGLSSLDTLQGAPARARTWTPTPLDAECHGVVLTGATLTYHTTRSLCETSRVLRAAAIWGKGRGLLRASSNSGGNAVSEDLEV